MRAVQGVALSLTLTMVFMGIVSPPPGASAQCFDCWPLAFGTPAFFQLGSFHVIQASVYNPSGTNGTLVVYMVVHDTVGRTLEYSTATIVVAPGAYGTAFLIVFGLLPGDYRATVFATLPNFVAVSATVTTPFSIQ